MQIQDALDRYLVQLDANGRSDHTRKQNQRHVRLLAAWAADVGLSDVEEIRHEHVARFFASPVVKRRADGAPRKATSTNAFRSSIRTFFAYVHGAGYAPRNPAHLLRRAICGDPPPRGLTDAERTKLLAALSAGGGFEATRDRVLFRLMLVTGIRVSSAVALDVEDVDVESGEIRIWLKRDRTGRLVLREEDRVELVKFIEARSGPIFRTRSGARLTTRQVHRRLRMWCDEARIRPLGPHALRHSFAVDLYRQTGDLLAVSAALHHRSILSTAVYAQHALSSRPATT